MSEQTFAIGAQVRITARPPYLKTADPMPMLRPPDLVDLNEVGTVLAQKLSGYWSIRCQRGTFLIDERYLEAV